MSGSSMNYVVSGPLGCHIWRGATTNGYPVMRVDGKVRQVRRVLYERARRPLKPGEVIELECEERLCVLVAHMHAKPRSALRSAGRRRAAART